MPNLSEGLPPGSRFILPGVLDEDNLHAGCKVEVRYYNFEGVMGLWCVDHHNQWVYVFPSAVTYHYSGDLPDRTVKLRGN